MLISEFARATGLTPDTVRFYVRKGLITPQTGRKGGANPYQIFGDAQVEEAQAIRLSQALGFSLKEIATTVPDYLSGEMTDQRAADIVQDQLTRLDRQAEQIAVLRSFLKAKLDWFAKGRVGRGPILVWPEDASIQDGR